MPGGTDSRTSLVPETSPPEMARQHGSPRTAGRSEGLSPGPQGMPSNGLNWGHTGGCVPAICGQHVEAMLSVARSSWEQMQPPCPPGRQWPVPTTALNVPMQGHCGGEAGCCMQQQATKKPPSVPSPSSALLDTHPMAALPAAKVSSDPRQGFRQTFQRTSGPPTDRMSGASSGPRDGKGTILDQGPGVTGENWGGAGVQRHSCCSVSVGSPCFAAYSP